MFRKLFLYWLFYIGSQLRQVNRLSARYEKIGGHLKYFPLAADSFGA
jgi:hypothetical protein